MPRFLYEVYLDDKPLGSVLTLAEAAGKINTHVGFPYLTRHVVAGWGRQKQRGRGNKAPRYAHIRLEKKPLTAAAL